MDDFADNSQLKKYEKIAVFIQPNIPPSIKNTFTEYILGHEAELYLYENYIKPIKKIQDQEGNLYPRIPMTLLDVISICTYIALSKETIDQAIRTYKENRRVYKRNWFNSIKEEALTPEKMKPKNPQSLRRYAEAVFQINYMDRSHTNEQSVEEIMNEKFQEIETWRSDTSAPITDFLFLREKPVKTLVNGFVNDITFESLNIIKNDFDGSIEGFNIRFPTDLTEHPIFSYRSTVMEFEPELLQNELTFLKSYQAENEDTGTVSEIQVTYTPDVELPATVTKNDLSKIMSRYHVDLKQRDLDMKDREIMTQLFNMINGETMSNPKISVDLREFTRRVYNVKVPKRKHYNDLGNRLEKLKNYDYKITVRNKESDELVETTTVGLLNYLYINYEECYFMFTPSEQWIRTYVQKKYVNLLTDSYRSIESPQTKAILMILQQERLTEYSKGSSSKVLTLKYFRAHMKLHKMGNAALIKELIYHLSILKDAQIVVKGFEFINKNSAVKIDFNPLDSKEIVAYDFNTAAIEMHSDIIDME